MIRFAKTIITLYVSPAPQATPGRRARNLVFSVVGDPFNGVVRDAGGNLYGTNFYGGGAGAGRRRNERRLSGERRFGQSLLYLLSAEGDNNRFPYKDDAHVERWVVDLLELESEHSPLKAPRSADNRNGAMSQFVQIGLPQVPPFLESYLRPALFK